MELCLTSVTALHFGKDGGKLLVDLDHAVLSSAGNCVIMAKI
jgi:hypothetical protein